jgi:uncharacterized protein with NRDE domain
MVNAYLRTAKEGKETSKDVAKDLVDQGLSGVGGFSLVFGKLRKPHWQPSEQTNSTSTEADHWKGLCLVSNRSTNLDDVEWLCTQPGETHALSNALYTDKSWPKVLDGEKLVVEAIKESQQSAKSKEDEQHELIDKFWQILSRNTLPERTPGENWEEYITKLRWSIFIPTLGKDHEESQESNGSKVPDVPLSIGESGREVPVSAIWDPAISGRYGTQKQTIILVDWQGHVRYHERTLVDQNGASVPLGKGDLQYDFEIDGWDQ